MTLFDMYMLLYTHQNMDAECQYIYLLQEREYENVYKIGKTT
jgi:hypothetical protein